MEFLELNMPNSGTSWPENETLFNMKDGGGGLSISLPQTLTGLIPMTTKCLRLHRFTTHMEGKYIFDIFHNIQPTNIFPQPTNIFPSVWNSRLARHCTCGKLWTRVRGGNRRGSTYIHTLQFSYARMRSTTLK